MPQFITRCPHCNTTFRTDETQLAAAAGKVRCGACMNIFLAGEHIVPETTPLRWELVEEPAAEEFRPAALTAELDQETEHGRFSHDNLAALRGLSNPLELEWFKRKRPGLLRTLAYLFTAVLLLAMLPVQYLWFHRETLSQDPARRPQLETLCRWLPCTLAPLRDLSAISTQDLLVRSHPRAHNALEVRMTFQNNATFAQPYPGLTLKFTNEQQQPVAMRSFLPHEYLTDGLHLRNTIPPGTSIQATLEIVDPGPDAINYEVQLRNL
ncbi:MAG: DUF3426 domain-containing protein [Pseudomonadales bacterium]|nr:DUF3426 domain-containing protein [Pseudomonadales bacterium]